MEKRFSARCYARAACAIMRCLSVCLSVCHVVNSVKTKKHIFKFLSPSASHTCILVFFQYQTAWQYSDGNPITGASNAGVVGRNRDSEPISGSITCCERSERRCQVQYTQLRVATDPGELMTLVAGKRQSLLMAGNNDEVYDKKPQPQRYVEDNRATFNCTQW